MIGNRQSVLNDKFKISLIIGVLICLAIITTQYSIIESNKVEIQDKDIEIERKDYKIEQLEKDVSRLEDYGSSLEEEIKQCKLNLTINRNNNSNLSQENQSLKTKIFLGW